MFLQDVKANAPIAIYVRMKYLCPERYLQDPSTQMMRNGRESIGRDIKSSGINFVIIIQKVVQNTSNIWTEKKKHSVIAENNWCLFKNNWCLFKNHCSYFPIPIHTQELQMQIAGLLSTFQRNRKKYFIAEKSRL